MYKIIFALLLSMGWNACKQPAKSNKGMDVENKKWVLIELNSKAFSQPNDVSKLPFLKMEAGKIGGTGGCNAFSGDYKLKEGNLSLSDMISTERFCEDNMDTERAFFKALAETKSLQVSKDGNNLSLLSENKSILAILKLEK